MSGVAGSGNALFEVADVGRARVRGPLNFASAGGLLAPGARFVGAGSQIIDLTAVESADSAGLALLIEWLSLSRAAGGNLRYENIPSQLMQLARLSEVEALLTGDG